jgi:hypothetical protein
MTTILFWLAIPFGFFGLPVGAVGFVLLPFAIVSLFNEFAAPRGVLLSLLFIAISTSLPPVQQLCGRLWRVVEPSENNFKHAMLLGSQFLSSFLTIAYLTSNQLIGATQSTWLLTTYWFICLVQLWGSVFLIGSSWFIRQGD